MPIKSISSRQGSSTSRPVVTIKHGKDPEVQEVDIATRIQHAALLTENAEQQGRISVDLRLPKKRKSKSMTTKSTMTNEDDYTAVHTNTPCTTPASSIRGENADDDVMEVGHKMVGWKMTPRVHFPPPNTINASSLRTLEARPKVLSQKDYKEFTVAIDPPYMHRPDRTLIVHQTKPMPMKPVKAWPGYGGNVYFQPFKVNSKPIESRSYLNRSPVPRSSNASALQNEIKPSSAADGMSMSRFSSIFHSTPSLPSTRKTPSRFSAVQDDKYEEVMENTRDLASRQMSHLDKNYILGLQDNGRLTEDLCWISGMESLGTLKIGNPLLNVKRKSTNETYTRHTLVEKVPRNFVFHPQIKNSVSETQLKNDEKVKSVFVQRYLKSYGIPEWALKQFVDKFYRDRNGRLKLPSIPLRVKGTKAKISKSNNEPFFLSKLDLNSMNTQKVAEPHTIFQPEIQPSSNQDVKMTRTHHEKKVPEPILPVGECTDETKNASHRQNNEQLDKGDGFSSLNELLLEHYANKKSEQTAPNFAT